MTKHDGMDFLDKDSKIYSLICKEVRRQKEGLVLIPSENYASKAVLRAMGTPLNNKYSEGYPGKRYYSGNKYVDEIERLAINRARKLFKAEHANVQPHSGSQANAAVYLAFLDYGDRVLGFDLASGGHLTHGSRVNFSGKLYKFAYYGVDKKTEMIDLKEVERTALKFKPKLIIVSTTAYSRKLDFAGFSRIAKKVKAYLFADIAHIAGLVAVGLHPSPFPYCDVATATTHKTLRGPRGGLILCKKKFAKIIDKAVFPGMQGGPLEHVIAAKAVCFAEAMHSSFKKYQKQVMLNSRAMADEFSRQGIRIVSGGTENHLMVLDVSDKKLTAKEIEKRLEKKGVYVNRNVVPFDKNPPYNPSGIRLGTPAITSRGFKEKEAREIARQIANLINKKPCDFSKVKKNQKEFYRI